MTVAIQVDQYQAGRWQGTTPVVVCRSVKMRFQSRGEAKRFCRESARTGAGGLRPYRCDRADHWHVTSQPRKGNRR